jgi:hypothetical protein
VKRAFSIGFVREPDEPSPRRLLGLAIVIVAAISFTAGLLR